MSVSRRAMYSPIEGYLVDLMFAQGNCSRQRKELCGKQCWGENQPESVALPSNISTGLRAHLHERIEALSNEATVASDSLHSMRAKSHAAGQHTSQHLCAAESVPHGGRGGGRSRDA